MSENNKKQIIYRCPVCFARENDVVLHKNQNGYYCVKCSFTGNEDRIQEMYHDLRKKFQYMTKRVTLTEIEKI